jgi:hypothetical protein
MFLKAFTDELLEHGRPALVKTALFAPRPDRLVERMGAIGGLSSGALYGLERAKAGLTADPYDGPQGSAMGALGKGALGGVAVAALLKLLGRIHGH